MKQRKYPGGNLQFSVFRASRRPLCFDLNGGESPIPGGGHHHRTAPSPSAPPSSLSLVSGSVSPKTWPPCLSDSPATDGGGAWGMLGGLRQRTTAPIRRSCARASQIHTIFDSIKLKGWTTPATSASAMQKLAVLTRPPRGTAPNGVDGSRLSRELDRCCALGVVRAPIPGTVQTRPYECRPCSCAPLAAASAAAQPRVK